MGHVRTSVDRWATMTQLLAQFERAIEGTSRLDAYERILTTPKGRPRRTVGEDHESLIAFGARVRRLEDRIDCEVDRLTSELLDAQLAEKQTRARVLTSAA
jgi:hypothetical protein